MTAPADPRKLADTVRDTDELGITREGHAALDAAGICDCCDAPPAEDDPYVDDFGHELECTHCGGSGECDANADPLWDCDDNPHPCHSCNGSGKRRDQTVF